MVAEFSTAPNLVIEALAGTGKTFTIKTGVNLMHWLPLPRGITLTEQQTAIVEAMQAEDHPGTLHMTSFSSDATAQLGKGLPDGVTCSSTYGMGMRAAKREGMAGGKSDFKYAKILSDFLGGRWEAERKYKGLTKDALTLCEKARLGLKRQLTEEELTDLAEWYGIEVADVEFCTKAVNHLLTEGLRYTQSFDYTDMVWIPVLKNLIRKEYDHLIVDEYQDMGIAQQEICYRVARRVIAIGDPNQAIYGFMGADADATKNFCAALGRTIRKVQTLPLTVTRRCCKAVVEYANGVIPTGLVAMPDASDGTVDYKRVEDFQMAWTEFSSTGSMVNRQIAGKILGEIGPKDMVICPTNAPMVMLLFKLVKAGKKAYVRKSEIVDDMRTYVSDFTKGIEELRKAIRGNVERLEGAKPSRANRVRWSINN